MPSESTISDRSAWLPAARERHGAALQRYATHLLGRDATRAQAVVQEVFMRLGELPEDEVEEDLTEWLFEECRHRAIAAAGGESRLGRSAVEGAGAADGEPPHMTMQRLIDRLTPKQQEAVRLRFQNGFSFKTIARVTDLSAVNVGVLIHHAMARLAQEFAEAQPEAAPALSTAGHDDPRLTTFALGEMEEAERKGFEDGLFDKKSANARVEAIRAVGNQIGQTLAIEAGAPAPRTVRRRKRRSFGALGWGVVSALVLGAVIFFAVRKKQPEVAPSGAEKVDFRLQPSKWQETPAADGESTSHVRSADIATGERSGALSDSPSRNHPRPSARAPAPVDAKGDGERSRGAASELPSRADETPSPGVAAIKRGQLGPESQKNIEATKRGEREELVSKSGPKPTAELDRSAENSPAASAPILSRGEESKRAKVPSARTASESKDASSEKRVEPAHASQPPVDAETASVTAMRRALAAGQWPARDAVKVGELLNYFPYHYAPPPPAETFSVAVESAEAPWMNPGRRLVRVGLKAREAEPVARPAALVVILLDVSASMAAPNRLPLAKEAVRLLLGRLRPEDRVGIVTYAGESRLTLDPQPVSATQKIIAALDRLEARGQTNGSAGLEFAYDLARAQPHWAGTKQVILCTDGGFNLGAIATDELTGLVDRWAESGVRLSVFGFGRTDRIDTRLEALAVHGRGASGYVNTGRDAERALIEQVDGLLRPVAESVQVVVNFNPAKVQSYRLLGLEDADSVVVNDETHSGPPPAGAVLPGHAMTALYEITPAAGSLRVAEERQELLTVAISYADPVTGLARQQKLTMPDRPVDFARASEDFRFAAAVAAFGLYLRAPGKSETPTLAQAEAWGRGCLSDDRGGYRQEFLAMIERARAVKH